MKRLTRDEIEKRYNIALDNRHKASLNVRHAKDSQERSVARKDLRKYSAAVNRYYKTLCEV